MEYLLMNGTIFDGTGKDRFEADLWIKEDKIAGIGRYEKEGNVPSFRSMDGEVKHPAADALVIDAKGKYVTPGFIDAHSHADISLAGFPGCDNYLLQGITTLSVGHCGMGVAPIDTWYRFEMTEAPAFHALKISDHRGYNPYGISYVKTDDLRKVCRETMGYELDWTTWGEHMDHLRRETIGCNIKGMASIGTARLQVLGEDFRRPATQEEIQQIAALVQRDLDSGANGVHIGVDYYPDTFASREEILACVKLCRKDNLLFDVHTQNQPERADVPMPEYKCSQGIREMLDIALEAGVRLEISHLVHDDPDEDLSKEEADLYIKEHAEQILKMIEDYRARGLDVNFDVIPPNCMCMVNNSWPEVMNLFYPLIFKAGDMDAFMEEFRKPAFREQILEAQRSGNYDEVCNIFPCYRRVFADPCSSRTRSIEITRIQGGAQALADYVSSSTGHPANAAAFALPCALGALMNAVGRDGLEVMMDLLLVDPLVCNKYPSVTPEGIAEPIFINHPLASIGFDSTSADIGYNTSPKGFPRTSCPPGNFNCMAQYLTSGICARFEDTVAKATGHPAQVLRMEGRGLLKTGCYADVVVLDPRTLAPHYDYVHPWNGPTGFDYVFVNGSLAADHGKRTGSRTGTVMTKQGM